MQEIEDKGYTDCLLCVWKHLASAKVLHTTEVYQGYPEHLDDVVGNLALAAVEAMPGYPELAAGIRALRHGVQQTLGREFIPNYNEVLEQVRTLISAAETA
jgi:hypothetical protein